MMPLHRKAFRMPWYDERAGKFKMATPIMNFMKLITGGAMLSDIFEDVADMETSMFAMVPMSEDDNDGDVEFVRAKSRFWFVHVVNAFQQDDDVVTIDLTVSTTGNPLSSPAVNISVNLNKTQRDEKLATFRMHVRRFQVNRTSRDVVETDTHARDEQTRGIGARVGAFPAGGTILCDTWD